MKKVLVMVAAILVICGTRLQAQTKRSDDFRARYELKEVVAMRCCLALTLLEGKR